MEPAFCKSDPKQGLLEVEIRTLGRSVETAQFLMIFLLVCSCELPIQVFFVQLRNFDLEVLKKDYTQTELGLDHLTSFTSSEIPFLS